MTYRTKAAIAAAQSILIAGVAVGISVYTTSAWPDVTSDFVLLAALFAIGGAFAWASEAMAIWATSADVRLRLVEARLWVPSAIAGLVLVFRQGPDMIRGLLSAASFALGFAMVEAVFGIMRSPRSANTIDGEHLDDEAQVQARVDR